MVEIYILLLLVALTFPFLYAPVYARYKISRTISLYIEQANIGAFPAAAQEYLNSVRPALVSNGFSLSAYLTVHDENPHTDVYGAIFINWHTGDLVITNYVTFHQMGRVFNITMAQFYTAFEDGSEIVTDNSPASVPFNRPAKQNFLQIPGLKDINYMYSIHRKRVETYRPVSPVYLPESGKEIPYLNGLTYRGYQLYVSDGLMVKDSESKVYRYTWKGAFIATWSNLFPIKQIRRALNRQKVAEARQLLEAGNSLKRA